eukprot:2175408-Rhodomonas_salina.2
MRQLTGQHRTATHLCVRCSVYSTRRPSFKRSPPHGRGADRNSRSGPFIEVSSPDWQRAMLAFRCMWPPDLFATYCNPMAFVHAVRVLSRKLGLAYLPRWFGEPRGDHNHNDQKTRSEAIVQAGSHLSHMPGSRNERKIFPIARARNHKKSQGEQIAGQLKCLLYGTRFSRHREP